MTIPIFALYLLLLIPTTWLAISLLGFDKIESYDLPESTNHNPIHPSIPDPDALNMMMPCDE